MAKFFNRSDKEVIEDAGKLTLDGFVTKYKETTGLEQLNKAYSQIRKEHNAGIISQQTTNPAPEVSLPATELPKAKVKAVTKKAKLEDINSDYHEAFKRTVTKPTIKSAGCSLTVLPEKKKPIQAKYLSDRIELRNKRIVEMLRDGTKAKDIIIKLREEGIIAHAPQITAINQALPKI